MSENWWNNFRKKHLGPKLLINAHNNLGETKMRGKCSINLAFCTSEEGLSFDELVLRVTELFKGADGLSKMVSVIVSLLQEIMIGRLSKSHTLPHISCCSHPYLCLHDRRKRRFKCSLGNVTLDLWRVRCRHCGHTHLLLANWLKFPSLYSRKSSEFEKIVIEAVTGTSYRRASAQIVNDHLPHVPKSTMNDWLLRTDCDELRFDASRHKGPMQVFADGTYVKGGGSSGKAVKRDIKIALGVDGQNRVFPIGTYVGRTWQEIAGKWHDENIRFAPGSVLITDGETGLAESLAEYADEIQRCQWHIDHDLYHMCRLDGKRNAFSAPIRRELRQIMAIELPEEDYQPVSEDLRNLIEKDMKAAEAKVEGLITRISNSGCRAAALYLERAKHGMFGYVRRWLRFGIACPKASSMIERVMRELGRRLKKIAYGWSDRGAEKMAKIILRKFTRQAEWDAYWKEKTNTQVPHFQIRMDGRIMATSPELQ